MTRPPYKALYSLKTYCEKTQCRRCTYGDPKYGKDSIKCLLVDTPPCDWDIEEMEDNAGYQ